MPTAPTGRPVGPTILVVDDDCDQRSLLGELLTLAGYDVVVACDGQDALDLLRSGLHPTVIVLDLAMPRMSGWAFLERLRGSEQSSIPVLVTTGEVRDPHPSGADACLYKPVDAAAFRSEIGRLSSAAFGTVPRG